MQIGFGSRIPWEAVRVILPPKGTFNYKIFSPLRRLIQRAEAEGRLVNAAHGRRLLSLMITNRNQVVLSAVAPETLWGGRKTKSGRRKTGAI
jgi:regulator of extracellular matrix RemA (YlzA/DUF370 family)